MKPDNQPHTDPYISSSGNAPEVSVIVFKEESTTTEDSQDELWTTIIQSIQSIPKKQKAVSAAIEVLKSKYIIHRKP